MNRLFDFYKNAFYTINFKRICSNNIFLVAIIYILSSLISFVHVREINSGKLN